MSTGIRRVRPSRLGLRPTRSPNVYSSALNKKRGGFYLQESRTTVSDSHCVYVGAGTEPVDTLNIVCMALIQALADKCGYSIRGWDSVIFPFLLVAGGPLVQLLAMTSNTNSVSGTPEVVSVLTLTNSMSWTTVVSALNNHIASQTATTILKGLSFCANTGATTGPCMGIVWTDDMDLHFHYKLKFRLQNITVSDGDQSTNVDANPLVGKIYRTKGWTNGFSLKQGNFRSQSLTDPFVALVVAGTGLIHGFHGSTASADIQGDDAAGNYFKKPVPGFELNAQAQSIVIRPGEIVNDTTVWERKFKFMDFMRRLGPWFQATNVGLGLTPMPFGCAVMFGLEKYLDQGSEVCVVQVGVQADTEYGCYVTTTRPNISRSTAVQSNAPKDCPVTPEPFTSPPFDPMDHIEEESGLDATDKPLAKPSDKPPCGCA